MSPRWVDVPAVLTRHGIDPQADAATLLAELEARGWAASVEERAEAGPGRALFRALALWRRSAATIATEMDWSHDHRQASGRTAEEALGRVLAAALERKG
jgi:hypothetical protein